MWVFLIFAVIVPAMIAILTRIRHHARYRIYRTSPEPRCPKCAYIIYKGSKHICPECGANLAQIGVMEPYSAPPVFALASLICAPLFMFVPAFYGASYLCDVFDVRSQNLTMDWALTLVLWLGGSILVVVVTQELYHRQLKKNLAERQKYFRALSGEGDPEG